jgi:TRAP-type mannitol/chloroaromatic compound transport system substrate-binding protein
MIRRLEESSTMPLNAKTMALCQKCGAGGCGALSGGRLEVTVSAAGEVVPAFEVLDAVGSGVAQMGHTAAF